MMERLRKRTLGQFGIEGLDPSSHHFWTNHITSCNNMADVSERGAESNRVAAANDGEFGPCNLQQVGQCVSAQHIRLRWDTLASIYVYITKIEGPERGQTKAA